MKRFFLTLAAVLLPAVALCAPPSADYKLVWNDEFDGTQLDESVWHHHQLGQRRDAFNTKEAVTLDGNGLLLITTSKNGDRYETGMIDTNTHKLFTYGYFEARVQMQTAQGFWSAFWLMPAQMKTLDTPDPGQGGVEMDVFEYLCNYPDELKHNFHWNGYQSGKHQTLGSNDRKVPGLGQGFHVIGLEWTPEEYVIYLDGVETYRSDKAVSHVPSYPIFSCEIGPWAGDIKKFDADLPNSLKVDYIRVYQK